jgi:hypothetical protein
VRWRTAFTRLIIVHGGCMQVLVRLIVRWRPHFGRMARPSWWPRFIPLALAGLFPLTAPAPSSTTAAVIIEIAFTSLFTSPRFALAAGCKFISATRRKLIAATRCKFIAATRCKFIAATRRKYIAFKIERLLATARSTLATSRRRLAQIGVQVEFLVPIEIKVCVFARRLNVRLVPLSCLRFPFAATTSTAASSTPSASAAAFTLLAFFITKSALAGRRLFKRQFRPFRTVIIEDWAAIGLPPGKFVGHIGARLAVFVANAQTEHIHIRLFFAEHFAQ